jgi:hypothetical protein
VSEQPALTVQTSAVQTTAVQTTAVQTSAIQPMAVQTMAVQTTASQPTPLQTVIVQAVGLQSTSPQLQQPSGVNTALQSPPLANGPAATDDQNAAPAIASPSDYYSTPTGGQLLAVDGSAVAAPQTLKSFRS